MIIIIRPLPCVSCPIPVGSSVPPVGVCAHSLVHVYCFLQLHMGTEPTPGFAVVTPKSVKYANCISEKATSKHTLLNDSLQYIRSEAFVVTEFSVVLSGHQLCQKNCMATIQNYIKVSSMLFTFLNSLMKSSC
jgi:hypothetical protein